VRIEILPPRNPAAYQLMFVVFIVGIVTVAGLEYAIVRRSTFHPSSLATTVYRILQIVDILTVGFVVAKVLTGIDSLTLSRDELVIQHRLLGVGWPSRRFRTSEVRNLRAAEWTATSRGQVRHFSDVMFEVGTTKQTFGNALTSAQADGIISRMREVYNFPEA
jgi:hypothetical protein